MTITGYLLGIAMGAVALGLIFLLGYALRELSRGFRA